MRTSRTGATRPGSGAKSAGGLWEQAVTTKNVKKRREKETWKGGETRRREKETWKRGVKRRRGKATWKWGVSWIMTPTGRARHQDVEWGRIGQLVGGRRLPYSAGNGKRETGNGKRETGNEKRETRNEKRENEKRETG